PRSKVRMQGEPGGHHNGVDAVSFAPDGGALAVAPVGRAVCLCDPRTGEERKRFQAVFPPPTDDPLLLHEILRGGIRTRALAFSPDGRSLVSCGQDGAVRIWEVATGEKLLEFKGHDGEVSYAAFGADGRSVLSGGADGQVYLWGLRPPRSPGPQPTLESL